MGMFDIIKIPCQNCNAFMKAQSKGALVPMGITYVIDRASNLIKLEGTDDIPLNFPSALMYLDEEKIICEKCKSEYEIVVRATANLTLISKENSND